MPSDDLANRFAATFDGIFSYPRHNTAEMDMIRNFEATKCCDMLIE